MRALVQRVTRASVSVDGVVIGQIGSGLCVLVGVTSSDDGQTARRLAAKLWQLRILDDDQGRMNRSLADRAATAPAAGGTGTSAEVLVISQFTLYGDTSRGRRPSWAAAAPRRRPSRWSAELVFGSGRRRSRRWPRAGSVRTWPSNWSTTVR